MKKILLFTASLMIATGAFAQGTIQFNNNITGSFSFRVYDVDPTSPTVSKHGNTSAQLPMGSQTYNAALALQGTGYTAELWGLAGIDQTSNSLVRLAGTTFRTGTAAGVLTAVSAVVPNTPFSSGPKFATVQMRVWNNLSGTIATWAAALANPLVGRGASEKINTAQLGGTSDAGTPGATDPVLTGMTSFSLAIVPEPSAIALGVLGLGTLMFLRRRR